MSWLLLALALSAPDAGARPRGLVDATGVVPGLVVELRYATQENFLRRRLYPKGARCLLVPAAAERLAQVARAVARAGYRLKVYDCYRPRSVQWEMWQVVPQKGLVADPRSGSHHNRGAAVDLTLVTRDGGTVEMPTDFDDFSRAARQWYTGGTASSRLNRERLKAAMRDAGFVPNPMEWWHYDLADPLGYPLLDEPFESPDAGD